MKRSADCLANSQGDAETSPAKKRKVVDAGSAARDYPNLPFEIWQHIVSSKPRYKLYRGIKIKAELRDQTALLLTSKTLQAFVIQIWQKHAAKKWPDFFTKVLALMKPDEFISTYKKLRQFSKQNLTPLHEEGRFKEMKCPLCEETMYGLGAYEEKMTCENCVDENGDAWKIEWNLPYEEYLCDKCCESGPFKAFACDECKGNYCSNCQESMQFNGLVYDDQESSFCINCAVDCEHCADWAAMAYNICERCKRPQCARCDYCDNSSRSSDSSSKSNDGSDSDLNSKFSEEGQDKH